MVRRVYICNFSCLSDNVWEILKAVVRMTRHGSVHALATRFGTDVRGFYDRPPFLYLGFVVSAKSFCCLLVAGWDHLAEVLKPATDILVRECVNGCVCEYSDNVLWRTSRHPQAGPR